MRDLIVGAGKRIVGRERAARARMIWELSKRRQFILINSHMRSYSTLLSHLIASTGEVSGYVEMRRTYRAEADLLALTWQVRSSHQGRLAGEFVLDKLLHRSHAIDDEVLMMSNVHIVVAVRRPVETVRSIVAMGEGIEPGHFWSDIDNAMHHYVDRLDSLADLARRAPRPILVRSDALVDDTEQTLAALSRALPTSTPVASAYHTGPLTGQAEFGDTSEYIQTGQIVNRRDDYSHIEISPDRRERIELAHTNFWDQMADLGLPTIG